MVWWVVVGLGVAYWLYNVVAVVRVVRAVPCLADLPLSDCWRWPRVSQIVPACNEAAEFREAVGSRLTEGYPDTEIIVVNDRSTDATGALADELVGRDGRVRVLHVRELPEGWLGKVHAMHRGFEQATGEWLLFSDADVHLAPDTLRRAVGYCEQAGLDHLCVFPDVWRGTWLLDIVMAMFVRVFCIAVRPHAVADPQSRAAAGVGAFNLVRRSAFERTPGLAGVRLDVVDDMALGQMLKEHGARSGVINGRGCVGLRWYESVADMAGGAEKSALASFAAFSVARLLAICGVLLLLELAPFVGLFAAGGPALRAVAAAGVVLALLAQLIPSVWFRRAWWPTLFVPVAIMIATGMMLRAGWLAVRRGGMLWRGTLYPMETLRRGARLRFP